MSTNINNLSSEILEALKNEFGPKWDIVKEAATDYFDSSKKRWAKILKYLADGEIDVEFAATAAKTELDILKVELLSFKVISLATAEQAFNKAVSVFQTIADSFKPQPVEAPVSGNYTVPTEKIQKAKTDITKLIKDAQEDQFEKATEAATKPAEVLPPAQIIPPVIENSKEKAPVIDLGKEKGAEANSAKDPAKSNDSLGTDASIGKDKAGKDVVKETPKGDQPK